MLIDTLNALPLLSHRQLIYHLNFLSLFITFVAARRD